MSYYAYKKVRDELMSAGWLDKYGNPVNTERYGVGIETDYNGNLWDMAADYINHLKSKSDS